MLCIVVDRRDRIDRRASVYITRRGGFECGTIAPILRHFFHHRFIKNV